MRCKECGVGGSWRLKFVFSLINGVCGMQTFVNVSLRALAVCGGRLG